MIKKRTTVFMYIIIELIIIITFNNVHLQTISDFQKITGFWEGEFMSGNNLTLILNFYEQKDGAAAGRIFLFQGEVQIQDDPLKNITLNNNQLSFIIEAKNTLFEGEIESTDTQITGNFKFPDTSVHPVMVKKVNKPALLQTERVQMKLQEYDILKKKYSAEQLQNDLNFLRSQLENTHPQLYTYTLMLGEVFFTSPIYRKKQHVH